MIVAPNLSALNPKYVRFFKSHFYEESKYKEIYWVQKQRCDCVETLFYYLEKMNLFHALFTHRIINICQAVKLI